MEHGYRSLRLYRSGVPVACSHGGTLHYSDGDSHRHSTRDHHVGLVRRAGGTRIGARWARVQHGEVPQPLHAAHLRLRDGELLRQFHPRTWLFHQGLHRRRHNQSCEPDWGRWFHHHAERDPHGILQDRTVDAEQHDVSVLRDCVLCRAIPVSPAGRESFPQFWPTARLRQRSSDYSGRSLSHFLSSTNSIGCSGVGSRRISDSAFTRSSPQPR